MGCELRSTKCQIMQWGFDLDKFNLSNVSWHLLQHLPKAPYSILTVSPSKETPLRFEPLTLETVHIIS